MTLADELSKDIWSTEGFKADLSYIAVQKIKKQIYSESSAERDNIISPDIISRVLQVAAIFASSRDNRFREQAQRIATAAQICAPQDPTVIAAFELIQSRLGNFPALALIDTSTNGGRAMPLSLRLEYFSTRQRNTIVAFDGADHILTDFQLESWKEVSSGRNVILSSPTSAGKSYVLLLYLIDALKRNIVKTVVYLVPTRALINQVGEDVQRKIAALDILDITVTTAPVSVTIDDTVKSVYILTQERLDALLTSNVEWKADLVFVDEVQTLSSGARGILLESVLDSLQRRDPKLQMVFAGPMLSNPREIQSLLQVPEFRSCQTSAASVTQNLIYVDYQNSNGGEIRISAEGAEQTREPIGTVLLGMKLRTDRDKLSFISARLGAVGSSIVYVGGKAEAEQIAFKIAAEVAPAAAESERLSELSDFVSKHIHPDYVLARTLKAGVAFHYGDMPSLLRAEIEEAFKGRKVSFLVCTSTLLHGLNLPARNLFMLKPTMGRNIPISDAGFWNLAGRAGRLGKESEGNVFLIDYARWPTDPLSRSKGIVLSSALREALVQRYDALMNFLGDPDRGSDRDPQSEIAAGKLVVDLREGRVRQTLERHYPGPDDVRAKKLLTQVENVSKSVEIPTYILSKNISVSPFRQEELYQYFNRRLEGSDTSELIPAHPLTDFEEALISYRKAMKRIHTYLLKFKSSDRREYFFAPLALRWMRGDPLPVIIDSAIRYYANSDRSRSSATVIRETMENVEQHLRFRYVKWFRCYNSLLGLALQKKGMKNEVDSIPDIPLYLEMGASSGAMVNLMALGLSRISAESVSNYVTNKDMELSDVRNWLRRTEFRGLDIPPACLREIEVVAQRLSAQAA